MTLPARQTVWSQFINLFQFPSGGRWDPCLSEVHTFVKRLESLASFSRHSRNANPCGPMQRFPTRPCAKKAPDDNCLWFLASGWEFLDPRQCRQRQWYAVRHVSSSTGIAFNGTLKTNTGDNLVFEHIVPEIPAMFPC